MLYKCPLIGASPHMRLVSVGKMICRPNLVGGALMFVPFLKVPPVLNFQSFFPSPLPLWQIGAPSGFMYAILTGRVHCTTEDGTRFVCGPGYPLGNLESQCGAPRWYEAVTETAVTALRNETDAFLDTIEQHFEMALDFVAMMAASLIVRRAEMREEKVPAVVA